MGGGGLFSAAGAVIRRAGGGEEHVIPSKAVAVLHEGDRLIIETAGGGGFGDPAGRERGSVDADLRDGKVSPDAARRHYGYDPVRSSARDAPDAAGRWKPTTEGECSG